MFRTIYGDEPTQLTLTAKASEAYDNSDVTIVEYTSEDDGSVICYALYEGGYLSSRHLICENLTGEEVNEYFEDLHDEIMSKKKAETHSITVEDWRRSGSADWDYFKRYLGNVVADMRGDTYRLALDGDDVGAWMESEIDDLVRDGKVTGDSTDEELDRVADDICVRYINSELGDVYGYAVYPDFRKLSPEAIVDLYRRGVGLDSLVQNWLYTARDNMSDGTVVNSFGVVIDYDAAVELMDDDLREELNRKLAPCTDQEFFGAYAKAHKERFGEEWELSKENPVY